MAEQRRTPGEVRRLILAAAAELFAAQGYARTSLREIAVKSGTAESMIFRNFGSKAELFRKTVLEPFNQHMEDYSRKWQRQLDNRVSDEEIFRLFITGLYDLGMRHRRLLLALMAVSQFEGPDGAAVDFDFHDILAEQEKIFEVEAVSRGFPPVNIALATRLMVGAILGAGLFDPWMMPKGRQHPKRDEIIEELVALCSTGVIKRNA